MDALFAGIDVGSSAAKAVLTDETGRIAGTGVAPTGIRFEEAAERAMEEAAAEAGAQRSDIVQTVACGYGRRNIAFADSVKTEIACLALGAHRCFEGPLLTLDIGGRDIKAICVDTDGNVGNFKLNTRCAAGTGAFLEDMALRLRTPLKEMNALAEAADASAPIGAHCTVFAAGEVLAAARKGIRIENIVLGIYESMAKRVVEMITTEEKTVVTGGVAAHNSVIRPLLASMLNREIHSPPAPQLVGALGASLFAIRRLHSKRSNL